VAGFGLEVLAGAALFAVLFGVPGWLFTRSLLFAPAAGVCLFGSLSIAICSLLGLGAGSLALSWAMACALGWRFGVGGQAGPPREAWIAVVVVLAGILPASQAWPVVRDDALYLSRPTYDHSKVVLVDAIARQGLLPTNPTYAQDGEPVALNYYWGLHFFMAQARVLLCISGWAADVAGTWLAAVALVGVAAGIALRLAGRARAGFLAALLCVCGPPSPVLLSAFGPGVARWFPGALDVERQVLNHMMWSPQHTVAAAVLLLLLWFATRRLQGPAMVMLAAGAFAAAWACSSWIAIAFALVSPLFFWVLRRERALVHVLAALPIAALLALPLFLTQLAGGRGDISILPIQRHILVCSPLSRQLWAQVPLYWLHFLPLYIGIAYPLGLLALAGFRGERLFRRISLAAILGALLVSQFIRSAIMNNDLGWRSVLLSIPLLNVWAAVAAAQLFCEQPVLDGWTGRLVRRRAIWRRLWIGGLVLGVLGAGYFLRWPKREQDPERVALHRRFLGQEEVWERVRAHAGPADLVQCNPASFATITFVPVNIGYCLFADRPTAVLDDLNVRSFAWRQPPAEVRGRYRAVMKVFSASDPPPAAVRRLRDRLKIKVLLVQPGDAVWPGAAIAASGAYRLVESHEHAKIFLAVGDR